MPAIAKKVILPPEIAEWARKFPKLQFLGGKINGFQIFFAYNGEIMERDLQVVIRQLMTEEGRNNYNQQWFLLFHNSVNKKYHGIMDRLIDFPHYNVNSLDGYIHSYWVKIGRPSAKDVGAIISVMLYQYRA